MNARNNTGNCSGIKGSISLIWKEIFYKKIDPVRVTGTLMDYGADPRAIGATTTMSCDTQYFTITNLGASHLLELRGDWVIDTAQDIDRSMTTCLKEVKTAAVVDCAGIGKMDTTGAVLIRRYANAIEEKGSAVLTGVASRHKNLLRVVSSRPPQTAIAPDSPHWFIGLLTDLGRATQFAVGIGGQLLSFIGLVLMRLLGAFFNPGRIRWTPLVHQLDVVGLRSMGIVGLIAFLIGAVMVNQGAIQLAKFGADIFVVDMLGISHLRELGILLTSIIVAGRSGSAITAEIGSMKLHDEVDAMKTLGMNPIDVLVLPRLIALMISLPLLTFFADIMGIAGGVMMAWIQLDISPANFLVYFRDEVSVDHFLVGMIKAPFFAIVIALAGSYHGLRVQSNSESLGRNTTRAVVEAIFLVIVLDALFAIFFTAVNL